jgi:hypothetical protein
MSSLDHLVGHPCHAAATEALAGLIAVAHGQPIKARACDDGSIALEIWGDDWRVLLCLEPDPAESGWSWVRINPAVLKTGRLDDIARLGSLIRSCLSE